MIYSANHLWRSERVATTPLRHSADCAYRDCVGAVPGLGASDSRFSLRQLRHTAPEQGRGAVGVWSVWSCERDDHPLHLRADLVPTRGAPCR
jgi:hypothetical protein